MDPSKKPNITPGKEMKDLGPIENEIAEGIEEFFDARPILVSLEEEDIEEMIEDQNRSPETSTRRSTRARNQPA